MGRTADEIVDDHLDALPLDLSSLRKNLPGAELYDACDPLQELKPHKLLEGQSTADGVEYGWQDLCCCGRSWGD